MVSYKPLWHTLISRDMKKMDLVSRGIVGRSTLAKMGRNEYVALEVIDRICTDLDCSIAEVVEVTRASAADKESPDA
ncbi:helix-turn-helix transcriptional regulator [uncultured Dysosmobacter sp.]|uniref:helix-turn-helix domain-containing protein n=1 Tax=uncultured Dysosmobacter sp. TaxID=2591384 RepID=UPI00260BB291|nr:helix-turn-helix domain-containing protein [uncultured Dysosmobacter sp.]